MSVGFVACVDLPHMNKDYVLQHSLQRENDLLIAYYEIF